MYRQTVLHTSVSYVDSTGITSLACPLYQHNKQNITEMSVISTEQTSVCYADSTDIRDMSVIPTDITEKSVILARKASPVRQRGQTILQRNVRYTDRTDVISEALVFCVRMSWPGVSVL